MFYKVYQYMNIIDIDARTYIFQVKWDRQVHKI